MTKLVSSFPETAALCEVSAEVISRNEDLPDSENLERYNLFMSPDSVIDDVQQNMHGVLLKDRHHRSSELPGHEIRRDGHGGVYSVRRLKGNGLYSGPREDWMHKIRNIKKDATGFVLGLQCEDEYRVSLANSKKLRQVGVNTEVPVGALKLNEVVMQTRDGVRRVDIGDAFKMANLPEEYRDMSFVVRIDDFGVNHRGIDYINGDNLIKGWEEKGEETRRIIIAESIEFMKLEAELKGEEVPDFPENDVRPYLRTVAERIVRNVALMHKNGATHGQLTAQNMTMDGRVVDYDTLEWNVGDKFDELRQVDMRMLTERLKLVVDDVLLHNGFSAEMTESIMDFAMGSYKQMYDESK